MTKEEMLLELKKDFDDPISEESGEYFRDLIFKRCKSLIKKDRKVLIEILIDWINMKKEPHTMLAVKIVELFKIIELKSNILKLGKDISDGKLFHNYYLRYINSALNSIVKNGDGSDFFKEEE